MISKIKKRDGRIVDFDPEKITNAIFKAAQSVGGKDRTIAESLTKQVVELLEKQVKPEEIPTVEQVQDLVEKVLVENRRYKTAKAYILYRQKRSEARRIKAMLGVQDELKLPTNALLILAARYLRKDASGRIIESTAQMFRRVAHTIAEVEKEYGASNEKIKKLEEDFYSLMTNFEFLPNCLSLDTIIPTERGLIGLGEISSKTSPIHERVASDKGQKDALFFFSNGPKEAWKVTTSYGFSIIATPEHFFRVIDENGEYTWKQLKDIGEKDWLALQKDFIFTKERQRLELAKEKKVGRRPRAIKYTQTLTPKLCEIVGYLLADGYIKRKTNTIKLAVNGKDRDLAEKLRKSFKEIFGIEAKIEKIKSKNCFLVEVTSSNLVKFLQINKLSKNVKSSEIEVPEKILRSSREKVASFLRAVFEADGYVGKRVIELYSNSLKFLQQVQLLLLGLGIVSKLRKKKEGYRLTIHKDLNGKLFVERINFLSKRKRELAKSFLSPKHFKDYIPNQANRLKEWYHSLKKKNYKLYRKIARFLIETKYEELMSGYIFEKYRKQFKELKSCYIKDLIRLNQFYDRIKKIEKIKVKTADLFVPGGNTYVANGFVTHNSPTLMNAGTGTNLTLSACFVLPIEDSIESIFETLKTMALVQKAGGGTGFSFSRLRPAGDIVESTGGVASGPISFMKIFDAATEQIKQGGRRRGANMGMLRVDHPDILDFIVCKEQEGVLRNFNISVAITDKFMDAVKKDKDFELVNPRNKAVVKTLKARAIWNLIVTMAWKNGEPGIVFIDKINQHCNTTPELGQIESTNPCVTGDTLISTEFGLLRMKELVKRFPEGGIKIAVDNRVPIELMYPDGRALLIQKAQKGVSFYEISKAFCTGVKDVFKVETGSGYELELTGDHKVLTNEGWVEVKDLIPMKHCVFIQSGSGAFGKNYELPFKVINKFKGRNGRTYKFNFPNKWSKELGQVLGLLVGDGWLKEGKNCRVGFTFSDKENLEYFKQILNSWYGKKIKEVRRKNGVYNLSYHSKYFVDFFKKLGVKIAKAESKIVPESIFTAPREAVIGFLQGLFSADGTVRNSRKSTSDWVALSSKSLKLLKEVQIILLNLGIKSRIFNRSRKPTLRFSYITKKGELRKYHCDGILYELGIFGENLDKFAMLINFISRGKIEKLRKIRKKGRREVKFYEKVVSVTSTGRKKVYDLTQPINHSMICNSLVVHQCGEQPLLPYESCNLGSINLSKMVKEVDGKNEIDWEKLGRTVRLAVRFLDNVIDANKYPVKQIEEMTKGNRKIGLGVMGFADLLVLLRIPYNSEEALNVARDVMKFITEEARKTSVELGKEKGNFPNFKGSRWDKLGYKHMRNATLTTIAPTGSISEIAGCSQGIEPLFAIGYIRNVAESLGTNLIVVNPYFERIAVEEGFYDEKIMKEVMSSTSIQHVKEIPEDVRKIFVTAHDISPEWHVKVQAAFQQFVDNSISKTINFPYEATPHDVEKVFMLAYDLGCLGVTVYRQGSREQEVLKPVGEGISTCEACELS